MKINKFITEAFQKIQQTFPKAKLEYQYKSISDTHFVKVTPSTIFETDAFIDFDFELTDQFNELGFCGSLCFLTEGSLVDLGNPSIIHKPKSAITTAYATVLEILENSYSDKPSFHKTTFQQPQYKYKGETITNEVDTASSKYAMAA